MRVTGPLLEAAIRAEFDYCQKTRYEGCGHYVPNEDRLRAIIQGVLDYLEPPAQTAPAAQPAVIRRHIVTARPPRKRG